MFNGLALFRRTSDCSTFNVASFHSPHSLTWSWILSVSFERAFRKGNGRLRFGVYPQRTNDGRQFLVTLPGVSFRWHRQQPMWFRDLYMRARDERDGLRYRTADRGA